MHFVDDASFAIILELQDDKAPSVAHGKVLGFFCEWKPFLNDLFQDPPPWMPADAQHTTRGVSDKAELHVVRAVDTGIINASAALSKLYCASETHLVISSGPRVSRKAGKGKEIRLVYKRERDRGIGARGNSMDAISPLIIVIGIYISYREISRDALKII